MFKKRIESDYWNDDKCRMYYEDELFTATTSVEYSGYSRGTVTIEILVDKNGNVLNTGEEISRELVRDDTSVEKIPSRLDRDNYEIN